MNDKVKRFINRIIPPIGIPIVPPCDHEWHKTGERNEPYTTTVGGYVEEKKNIVVYVYCPKCKSSRVCDKYKWEITEKEQQIQKEYERSIKPVGNGLSQGQLDLMKTLWELAQGRIDTLYSVEGAEDEKQAIEVLIRERLSWNDASELIRANSPIGEME